MTDRSYPSHLRCGTMLLALAVSSLPSAAWADNVCGEPEAGSVVCDPGEADGSDRIVYMIDPAQNSPLTISFADGFAFNGGGSAPAIYVSNVNGAVNIEGAGLDITTGGEWQSGLMAASYNGDLNIDVRYVVTQGEHSAGVIGVVGNGNAVVNVRSVETHGDNSHGIAMESNEGSNITVNAGQVKTTGFSADGIVVSSGGDATVNAGTISASGDWSFGINVTSNGSTNIAVDKIETSGYAGVGIVALSYFGDANVRANEIATVGEAGTGVVAQSLYGNASITAGKVTTKGSFADGIAAISEFGTTLVNADEVRTEGEFSFGVYAGSSFGEAHAVANSVSTKGHFSDGVAVSAGNAATAQVKDASTEGDYAFAVFALGGTAHVQASGTVSTKGNESSALVATSRYGDATVEFLGPITTAGRNAHGVEIAANLGGIATVNGAGSILTTGTVAHGVKAISFTGDADIKVQQVETRGDGAHGIYAETSAETGVTPTAPSRPGSIVPEESFATMRLAAPQAAEEDGSFDIKILAGDVTTSGLGSIGIRAKSAGRAEVDAGNVTARSAKAVSIEAVNTAALNVRGAIRSVNDDGALVSGSDVNVTLAAGSSLAGGGNGIVVRANGPAPEPAPVQVLATAIGNAVISNAGLIRGGEGHAILVEAGAASIDNLGTVLGSVSLGAGDDQFVNKGTHEIWKDSEFGAGNDVYRNVGELRLSRERAAGPIIFAGLERFDNQGLINLANGTAGDSLVLPGDYHASGKASLLLDLDPSKGTVDSLAVNGKLTGRTKLSFSVTGEAGLLGDQRLVIAQGEAGSATDLFELAQADAGFVRYGVTFDAPANEYVLISEVGEGAYRASSIAAGIRHGLADLGESWSSHDAERRGATEPGRGFWAVGSYSGAKGDRRFDAAGSRSILRYEEDRQSYLVGVDLWAGSEESGFSGGLLGGYQSGQFDFRHSTEESRSETALIGAYARYARGPLFASLVAQYARHWLGYEAKELGIDERTDGSSWGARLEGGYRVGTESWFFEPVVSVAFQKQDLDALSLGDQQLELSRRASGRVSVGARSGAPLGSIAGVALRGNASAGFARDFGGREKLVLSSGDEQADAHVGREKTSVWTALGLEFGNSGPVTGFTQVRLDRSDDLRANSVRAGVSLKL